MTEKEIPKNAGPEAEEFKPTARDFDRAIRLFGKPNDQCPLESENAYLEGQTERKLIRIEQVRPDHAYVMPLREGYIAFMTSGEENMRNYDGGVLLYGVDMFVVSRDKNPNGEYIMNDQMMHLSQRKITDAKGILVPREGLRKDIERKVGRTAVVDY